MSTSTSITVTVATAISTTVAALLVLREIRALRRDIDHLKEEKEASPAVQNPTPEKHVSLRGSMGPGASGDKGGFKAAGVGRMKAVGTVLSGLPRAEHNKLVAALSKRAAPVSQWGPVSITSLPPDFDPKLPTPEYNFHHPFPHPISSQWVPEAALST